MFHAPNYKRVNYAKNQDKFPPYQAISLSQKRTLNIVDFKKKIPLYLVLLSGTKVVGLLVEIAR